MNYRANIPFGSPLRIGLIGTGGVVNLHLPAFLEKPDEVQLTAVCDVRPEAAEAYAKKAASKARIFTDYHDLMASGLVDLVVVALPHYLHFPVAKDTLEAGLPTMVEKPLTCTLEQTRALREIATRKGVPLVVGLMRRFEPDAVWLHHWVHENPRNFGDLHSFDIQSWQNVLGYINPTQGSGHWILDGERAGGGVVISLAVHQLDLIRFITGCDYVEVFAQGRFDPPFYNGAESSAIVSLKMSNGASGALHASYTAPRVPYSEAMSLFGSQGTIVQRAEEIGQYHGPFRYASVEGRETSRWGQMYENLELVPSEGFKGLSPNPFVNEYVQLARALREGRTPKNSVDENFNTMACLQAINDSLKSGKPERVATQ